MKPEIYIGIDPGTKTGFARWHAKEKKFGRIETVPIHKAISMLEGLCDESIFVRVEDARKRQWFGRSGREKLQGAGSIKRDCSIWEDFLTDMGIPFEMVPPKNVTTKMNAKLFQQITGWRGRTSNHARDAAMLVFGI